MPPQYSAAASGSQRTDDAIANRSEEATSPPPAGAVAAAGYSAIASFGQERLWTLDQLLPDKSVYNEMQANRLTGPLDVRAIERALDEVVARHDVLRTSFALIDGELQQVVDPVSRVVLDVVDLGGQPADEREAQARRCAEAEIAIPFDLGRGPLIRARLLRLAPQEHWLLLTRHHIVTDRWSAAVLARELSALYGAFSRGESSPLPELPVQYADYAVWQRERLQGTALEERLAYWTAALANLPTLDLPTDRHRPAVASFRGGQVEFEIDERLTRALKALSQSEGATLFMTLLAAFQVLLHRLTGQEDVAVGVPVAGRSRVELEELIGFFVNTIVLRGDLSGEPSFREYLARVRVRALDAYAHQDLPFEKVVERLAPSRDLSRNPLYQVGLRLGNTPSTDLALPGLAVRRVEGVSGETAKHDLSVGVNETGGRLAVRADYAADLFDAATVERMMAHWRVLLEGIVADPGKSIARLPLLTEAERRQLLAEWNDTAVDCPLEQCIQQLFEEQVERTPDAAAVVYGAQELTYAELNARANQLAHHLRRLGVGPEVLVAIALERSLELIVGLLGILKAGGAYVPLDPDYPTQRLAFILEDTQAPVLLTQQRLLDQLPDHGGHTLCLDRDWGVIAQQPGSNPAPVATVLNLAYVIFTSGSTGQPKGVMVEHRSLANFMQWTVDSFYRDRRGGSPVVLSIAFDGVMTILFGPLLSGQPLYLPPPHGEIDAIGAGPPARGRYALVKATPSHLKLVNQQLDATGAACPTAALMVGGEALIPDDIAYWQRRFPEVRLINHYGPTEATVGCCSHEIVEPVAGLAGIPIGRPNRNAQAYILDAHLAPVPIGIAGELYIAGAGVARGYLNRPELTSERFVADPFGPAGTRMYRTGDRARWRADGVIEFLGRNDLQVKIRGFRVELGEIETALSRHPGVGATAVTAPELRDERGAGSRALVAYIVPRDVVPPTGAMLRQFLATSLPDHMVPGAYVLLDALPLSPNGKVDRARLPLPGRESFAAVDVQYVAPRDGIEEQVAEILAEVLGLDHVGVHGNFFELGGHSLLAIQALARIRAVFGIEVPVRGFFEAPTVAGLARRLEGDRGNDGNVDRAIVPVPHGAGPVPVSYAQQRLWVLDRLSPGDSVYNMRYALRLCGGVDVGVLAGALNEVVRRHEVLRTRIAVENGQPVQMIAPTLVVALGVDDLRGLAVRERDAEARRRAQLEAQAPFVLERGPLLRARLLRLEDEEYWLLLTLHHIVSDGWSSGVLWRELSGLYRAFGRGLPSPLPELPVQYADYAVWQREWLQGPVLERQLTYWKKALADLPVLELPTDRPRPRVASHRGGRAAIELGEELTRGLKELGRREGATLFMTLLAALQVLLYRHSAQEDVAVGVPIAGRSRPELEGLIGFFVNTLVLRGDLSGEPGFREVLARVRARALEAYAHQDLPFEKLVEELHPQRDLSRNPLFDVMLNLVEGHAEGLQLDGIGGRSLERETSFSKFAMTLYVRVETRDIGLNLVYQDALFSAERMQELLRQYQHLLTQIVEAPARKILSYSLVTPTARSRLPDPSAVVDAPPQQPVTELFARWAERQPDSVAVTQGVTQWSYRALADAANRIAQSLHRRGIGSGDVVAICGSRSFGLVSSMLGVLLSGGVFLAVDGALPEARRRTMLREARARAVCRVGAAPLPDGWSEMPECAMVFEIDPDRGLSAPGDVVQPSDTTMFPPVHGNDAAYIFFTSGSTGVPKGVLGCHKSLGHFLAWQRQTFDIGPSDRVAQLTGLSFDVLLRDVFLPLTSGGILCLPGEDDEAEPLAWIARERVTVVHAVPTLLQSWLAQQAGSPDLRDLRWLFLAGEPLSGALVQAWRDRFPGCAEVVNLYGPTETTLVKCFHRVTGEIPPGLQPVGMPLPQTQALVLNAAGQPCGIGEPGEVVLRTPFRTLGYVNAPQEMRTHFVPNAFREGDESDLLYYTGDRGRYRPDGTLDLVGRLDDQVKIRGVRIEPGEVQAVLGEHPGVQACVVMGRKDVRADDCLAAYVVRVAGRPVTIAELRAFLGERLPAALVPSAWQFLDDLPRLPSGKIDRRALPAPDVRRIDVDRRFVAPRNDAEARLAAIFAETLGLEAVGVHDDYFALGGHSLLVMQLLSRVKAMFGAEVDARHFFGDPTIAGLANHLVPVTNGSGASDCGSNRPAVTGPQITKRPKALPSASRKTHLK